MNTKEMRIDILRMALAAKSQGAHLGGSLSMVEIMAALYGSVMKLEPGNMENEHRDRLVISKGHGVMAQYVALKQLGLLTEEQMLTYKSNNTAVNAHPSVNAALGIEFAGGSLGQGLSLGVGLALALRRKGNAASRVFVELGDAECDEGSVWEAAMSASHYGLNNIVTIVDRNGLQYDGPTEDILALADLEAKWKSFGWNAVTVNGHDVNALVNALSARPGRPLAIVAETVKGKGVSFMEHAAQWHNGVVTQRIFEQAMAELVLPWTIERLQAGKPFPEWDEWHKMRP